MSWSFIERGTLKVVRSLKMVLQLRSCNSRGCNSRVATQKNLTLNVVTAAKVARLQLLQLLATSDWSAAIIIFI